MLLIFQGTQLADSRFPLPFKGIAKLNVETPTRFKPHPMGNDDPFGAALRQAAHHRFDHIPDEIWALLARLDRVRAA